MEHNRKRAAGALLLASALLLTGASRVNRTVASIPRQVVTQTEFDRLWQTQQQEHPRIALNTATLTELCTLPGVAEHTAEAILHYRAEHGVFASVDELLNVPGIGARTLEQLAGSVCVADGNKTNGGT